MVNVITAANELQATVAPSEAFCPPAAVAGSESTTQSTSTVKQVGTPISLQRTTLFEPNLTNFSRFQIEQVTRQKNR